MDITHPGAAPASVRRLRSAWALARDTAAAWQDDHASSRAAALAYYAVISIAPALLIAIAIASALVGEQAARGELRAQLHGLFGDATAHAVESLIAGAAVARHGLAATLLGVVVLSFAASRAFTELQRALDAIWRVPAQRTRGVLAFLKRRAISIAAVLSIGVLLLSSVLSSAALAALGAPGDAAHVVHQALSFGVTTLLFAAIFRFLPRAKVTWREVWLGALVTSVAFGVGGLAFSLYLTRSALASAYGAAGAVMLLLAWVYASSVVLLFGAELTRVFARSRGLADAAAP